MLPGLPTGPNIGGGPSTRAGGNASVNTKSGQTPALSLCTVSVYVWNTDGELLNSSRSQALQQEAEVQRRYHCTSVLR